MNAHLNNLLSNVLLRADSKLRACLANSTVAPSQFRCLLSGTVRGKHWEANETELPAQIWDCLAGCKHALRGSQERGILKWLCSLHRKPEAGVGVEVWGSPPASVPFWSFFIGEETRLELCCCFWAWMDYIQFWKMPQKRRCIVVIQTCFCLGHSLIWNILNCLPTL